MTESHDPHMPASPVGSVQICAFVLSTVVVGSQTVPGNAAQSGVATQPGKQVLLLAELRMQKPFCPKEFTPPELSPAQSAEVAHEFVHHPAHAAGSHAQFVDVQTASDEQGSPRPAVQAVQFFSAHERSVSQSGTPLGERCVQSQVELVHDDSQLARRAQSVCAPQFMTSVQQALLTHAPHVVSVGWLTHVIVAASPPPPPASPPPPPASSPLPASPAPTL